MNLYLDKHNGVWKLLEGATNQWELISSNHEHMMSGTVRGSEQNDATMLEEFAPLVAVSTGDEYEFREYTVDDKVWIDGTWLRDHVMSELYGFNPSGPESYAGVVVEETYDPNRFKVSVNVRVSTNNLKPRTY